MWAIHSNKKPNFSPAYLGQVMLVLSLIMSLPSMQAVATEDQFAILAAVNAKIPSGAILNSEERALAERLQRLIGTKVNDANANDPELSSPKVLAGYDEGFGISAFPASYFGISKIPIKSKYKFLTLQKDTGKVAINRRNEYIIKDYLILNYNEDFLWDNPNSCYSEFYQTYFIFAVGKIKRLSINNDIFYIKPPSRAWIIDTVAEKFKNIPTNSISCELDMSGSD
jgi:hypothetical protein